MSALRRLLRLLQSKFSRKYHLVFPLTNLSNFSFPYGHPVGAYVFIHVSSLFLSFILSFHQTKWFKRQYLLKIRPVQLKLLRCMTSERLQTIQQYTDTDINTLRTGDADLRLYITTVQDGWRKSEFLTRAWFPRTIHLITQYMERFSEWSCWRMFIRGLELS